MEGPSGVTRSIIDETHSSVSSEIKENEKAVLLEVSLMNLILGLSQEIKMKVKVMLVQVSLMNFILRISNEIK